MNVLICDVWPGGGAAGGGEDVGCAAVDNHHRTRLDEVGEDRGFLLRFRRRESRALCALSLVVTLLDDA